jgi:hypothetical protein
MHRPRNLRAIIAQVLPAIPTPFSLIPNPHSFLNLILVMAPLHPMVASAVLRTMLDKSDELKGLASMGP